jgi:hypothetical protein
VPQRANFERLQSVREDAIRAARGER